MKGRTAKLIETISTIAKSHGATSSQIALSWVLSHTEISVAISGSDTEEQMKENIKATEITLTENELNKLNNDSIGLNYVLDGDPEELWEQPIY